MNKTDKQKEQRLYNNYGMTLKDQQKLFKFGCFLCGSKKRLAVDHRHVPKFKKLPPEEKFKEVRGCLCFRHNKFTIGGLEIDKNARELLNKVNAYFAIFPMKGDV